MGGLAVPATVFIGVFYLWPVGTLIGRSFTLESLRSALHDPAIRHIAWFTTWQAGLSTMLTVAIGLVPAYLLARFEFRGRRLLTAAITVPFVLPTVVVGAAFLALLPDRLDQSVIAIVMAHVFFNVAVVVRGVGGLWEQLPPDLGAAARTLGASPSRTMREITLPLLTPAIAASASIVFLFTFTSFGVVRLLGGPAHPTLEVEIWQQATRFGDVGVAAVLSVAQLVVLGLAVAWFSRLQTTHRRALDLAPLTHRQRARTPRQRAFVIGATIAILVAIAVPVAALVDRSLRTGPGHSLAAWRSVFGAHANDASRPTVVAGFDPLASVVTSLRFALIAMVISVVVGGCAALAISTLRRGGRLLDTGLMLPLGTSAVTIGFGLLITFDTAPFDWRGSPWMIPLGHALVATPFVVRLLLPVLRSIDPDLRDAASTLGASPIRVWREIDLRMLGRPLLTGAGFALAISLGEFGATSLLTRSGRETLPIAIERLLNRPGALLHAQGYVLATVLAALTFVIIGAVEAVRLGSDQRA
ncbi:MAG: ABC transporter permease subunit [Actinobacteria bacterium]|nr:ABC transporter permease subunit [Actinomycetota bacterium]